jgi:hypothetical protein
LDSRVIAATKGFSRRISVAFSKRSSHPIGAEFRQEFFERLPGVSGLIIIEGFLDRSSTGRELFIQRMLGAPKVKALFGGQRRALVCKLVAEKTVERIEFVHNESNLEQDPFSITGYHLSSSFADLKADRERSGE